MRTNIQKSGNAYFMEIYDKNGKAIKYFKFNKRGKYIKTMYLDVTFILNLYRWKFKAKNLTKEEIIYADLMFKLGIDPS